MVEIEASDSVADYTKQIKSALSSGRTYGLAHGSFCNIDEPASIRHKERKERKGEDHLVYVRSSSAQSEHGARSRDSWRFIADRTDADGRTEGRRKILAINIACELRGMHIGRARSIYERSFLSRPPKRREGRKRREEIVKYLRGICGRPGEILSPFHCRHLSKRPCVAPPYNNAPRTFALRQKYLTLLPSMEESAGHIIGCQFVSARPDMAMTVNATAGFMLWLAACIIFSTIIDYSFAAYKVIIFSPTQH